MFIEVEDFEPKLREIVRNRFRGMLAEQRLSKTRPLAEVV